MRRAPAQGLVAYAFCGGRPRREPGRAGRVFITQTWIRPHLLGVRGPSAVTPSARPPAAAPAFRPSSRRSLMLPLRRPFHPLALGAAVWLLAGTAARAAEVKLLLPLGRTA